MSAFIIPNRDQMLLLTQVDLSTVAAEGSVVSLINELIDSLDTAEIESGYQAESDTGRPAFHPKTLLKVALLALHSCRFSLRKIEQDTENNLAYKWLTGDMIIDHSTMGLFLARYATQIVELFSQVVGICQEQDLIEFDLLAIDSIKLRANANYKQSKTLAGMEKEGNKIQARLTEILENAADEQTAEAEELRALSRRSEKVREAKGVLMRRLKEKSREVAEAKRQQLREKEKVNITDPEAQIMQQANGERNPSYSITTTTDVGHDIITHFQLNAQDNDSAALLEAIEGSRQNTGEEHREVEADAGFASMDNYEQLEAQGQGALIPDRRLEVEQGQKRAKGEYDRGKFVYREQSDTYRCPLGKVLEKTGSVQANGRIYDRYENARVCVKCSRRSACTKGKHRMIFRDRHEEVRDRMREKLSKKRAQRRYHKRAHAAESPFGQVKGNLKFRGVMRRGVAKVRMEVALLFMLHNMLKMAAASA
jgi:transposase